MKRSSLLFSLIMILALLSACGPTQEPQVIEKVVTQVVQETIKETVVETVVVEVESPAARAGGVLNYSVDTEPDRLDPNLSAQRGSQIVFFSIYDCLIALDPATGTYIPWLATSWDISEDGKTYTFKLRDDVTFHDGTPFNAEAVKFNFDRHHDPELDSRATGAFGFYESSEVVDEYTVAIHLNAPLASFLDDVSYIYRMVSPAAVEEWGNEDFGRHPVGTGPFKFVEWVANDHVTLEKNPDYNWAPDIALHQGPAYLDQVIFRHIQESGTRIAALEKGEVQAAVNVPSIEAGRLDADPAFKLAVGRVPGIPFHFALNHTKPPIDDVAVRQAMNYGLDREAIVKTIYGAFQGIGANTAAYTILAPITWGYDKNTEMYRYDAEKAMQLLDDAGWTVNPDTGIREKDGQPLEVILNTWEEQSVADVAQAQLREIGIDIKLGVLPVLTVNEMQRAGESHGSPLPFARSDPGVLAFTFHSDNIGGWNLCFLDDPEMDALLDAAASEMDRDKRAEMYSDVQRQVMEQALVLPLYNRDNVVAVRDEVQQLRFDRGFFPLMYDTWLKQ
jgi:peptide/nickel transport system substrate-binding protein